MKGSFFIFGISKGSLVRVWVLVVFSVGLGFVFVFSLGIESGEFIIF